MNPEIKRRNNFPALLSVFRHIQPYAVIGCRIAVVILYAIDVYIFKTVLTHGKDHIITQINCGMRIGFILILTIQKCALVHDDIARHQL